MFLDLPRIFGQKSDFFLPKNGCQIQHNQHEVFKNQRFLAKAGNQMPILAENSVEVFG